MKKLTLIFLIIFSVLFANAQEKKDTLYQLPKVWAIGIKANAGASMVDYNFGSGALVVYSNKLQGAFNGGMYFNNILNDNESFCFEILFLQMNGLLHQDFSFTDSLGNPGSVNTDDYYHLSYLSIPLYYKYSISKFSIGIGVQVSYLLGSKDEFHYSVLEYGQASDTSYTVKNLPITKFDYGPKLMLFYQLSNKLSLSLDYYYGLQNLYNDVNSLGITEKNQQFSFGVAYRLY